MCCHYTTAAKNTINVVLPVYWAESGIAIHFNGLQTFNPISAGSGDKWRRDDFRHQTKQALRCCRFQGQLILLF